MYLDFAGKQDKVSDNLELDEIFHNYIALLSV